MYSQQYSIVDNAAYGQQRLQPPLHPTVISRPLKEEPLPSATDDKPNITLSISEIAEFSSTMVYLMWHARRQSVMDLHSSSKTDTITHNNNSLEQTRVTADMANMTSAAFKKFSTQLSESVVLLSLKYIAMLLQNNPHIQGADGSEYRLFTVALMLANKFLDDNTFTNKTWSEVSGMKVTDLNIMELEFLDVLRFELTIRKEEYERWRTALFGFRSQLIDVPIEIQRQRLMETMALSVNSNSQQWMQYAYQQQQHAATVAAAAATHNFFLFSKTQQQYLQPTLNVPPTRVQLRIPPRPVYQQDTNGLYENTNQQCYVLGQTEYPAYQKPQTQQTNSNPLYIQPQQVKNTSYYYTTPSNTTATKTATKTATTTATTTATATTSSTATLGTTTSYYVDPTLVDYNPYTSNYHRQIPRSTSYKNMQQNYVQPTDPLYSAYNEPSLEDPLTNVESYRIHR
ncbi:uncharacterized protein B0P05DRAFT_582796 [Gilbertella persicaria]|uniref:uncharacterized protein n=1 Tax=Gilbertella persicaria TaxID=101096 RepID=UPI00222104EE|nr:uncharacterized protein B0P05DRAFT_582796 [Gilbertella persicaria]KAI8097808.1 hypothetical protein B0P05DRAFT_582796 [Gilbertella persicaria]